MAKPPKISKQEKHDAGQTLGDPKSTKREKELAAEVMRQIPRKPKK